MRYVVRVQLPAAIFDEVRARASQLANRLGCDFWWKPYPDDQYDFIFSNDNVGIYFRGLLAAENMPAAACLPDPDFSLEEIEQGQSIMAGAAWEGKQCR